MTERDWNKDWWDATSPDVLTKRPASFDFEMYLQQRKVLQYWLKRVRELEGDIEALEIMLGMKDVPPPRTWVPTEWLDNLKEIAQISRDAWAYVWQLIDIYRTHDHPEIEARPIIDVLDKLFILWQCRWWYLRHTTEHEYCCKEVCNNETFRGN